MNQDKNESSSTDRQETDRNESASQKHQNPFEEGKNDTISDEEVAKEQEFKEAQTERD